MDRALGDLGSGLEQLDGGLALLLGGIPGLANHRRVDILGHLGLGNQRSIRGGDIHSLSIGQRRSSDRPSRIIGHDDQANRVQLLVIIPAIQQPLEPLADGLAGSFTQRFIDFVQKLARLTVSKFR